jgi:hypothetical protein
MYRKTLSLTLVAASAVALTPIQGHAASTIDLDVSNATLDPITNFSAQALRLADETAGLGAGNRFPEVQFQIQSAGLAAGTYTATVDLFYVDKPDQQRSAMRRAANDGDNSDFNQTIISNSDLSTAVDLDQWYRVTAPVLVTSAGVGDVWNGTFELRPTIFGGTNDPADAFDVWIDNVDILDASNASVLENGPYTFEGDTLGQAPANVSLLASTTPTAFEVVAVPEPASVALAAMGVTLLLSRRR